MTFILLVAIALLGYKLYQANKQKQLAYNHYMDDRIVNQPQPNYMVGSDGVRRPMWCPNCGRNL